MDDFLQKLSNTQNFVSFEKEENLVERLVGLTVGIKF